MLEKKDWLEAWGQLYEGIKVTEDVIDEQLALSEKRTRERLRSGEPQTVARIGEPETIEEWKNRIGDDLPNRSVGKFLGRGTCGSVHLLESSDGLSPLVAKFANQPESVGELEVEAEIYERVGDHPNIPKCLGVVEIEVGENKDKRKALVLEAIVGDTQTKVQSSLQTRYENGKLSHEEYWGTIQYMQIKLLQGLAHLEQQGLVHSDVKPDNIMIDGKTGDVKIIDLGGAVQLHEDRKASTRGFGAPESKNLTGAFDVYSTGKVAGTARNDEWKKGGKSTEKNYKDEYTKFMDWLTNEDPLKRPTATEALSHPFLSDILLDEEGARKVIIGVSDKLTVTPGFSRDAWDRTMDDAVKKQTLPVGSSAAIRKVSDALDALGKPPAVSWKDIRREPSSWNQKSDAMNTARPLLEQVLKGALELKKKATADTQGYLMKVIARSARQRIAEIEQLQKAGPPELTTTHFADKWRAIKSKAEIEFKTAVQKIESEIKNDMSLKTMATSIMGVRKNQLRIDQSNEDNEQLDEEVFKEALAEVDVTNGELVEKNRKQLAADLASLKKGFEKFFGFTDDFSGALNAFEKADTRKFDDLKAKALRTAETYFKRTHNAIATFNHFNPTCNVDTAFVSSMEWSLNDLTYSISQKKAV